LLVILSALAGFGGSAPGLGKETQRESNGAGAIAFPARSPSRFEYAQLLDRNQWLVADSQCLWKTDNGGLTWTQSYPVGRQLRNGERVQGLSFIDRRIGFLIVDRRLFSTEDSGLSWQATGSLDLDAIQCQFIDRFRGWVVGSITMEGWIEKPDIPEYVGEVVATQDGGKSWQRQPLKLPKDYFDQGTKWSLRALFFDDGSTGWLAGDELIFSTTDGGATWRLLDAPHMDYSRIRFLDGQFGWATERQGSRVAVTRNGGSHWDLLSGPPGFGSWPAQAVFVTSKHGFATVLSLYETKDGGKTWLWRAGGNRPPARVYEYLGVALDGTLAAMGINDGKVSVLLSGDSGLTWEAGSN